MGDPPCMTFLGFLRARVAVGVLSHDAEAHARVCGSRSAPILGRNVAKLVVPRGLQVDMLPAHQAPPYPLSTFSNSGRKPDASRTQTRSKRKTALQKQLEGNVRRTIYICDIDQQVRSMVV